METVETDNIAELSALIRNIGTYPSTIRMTTENASVARRIFSLLKELYSIIAKITVRRGYNYHKGFIYILEVTHKVNEILTDLSLRDENRNRTVPQDYILDDPELKRAYLRGLFLASGSVNDPKKSRYHLEFLVDEEEYALFICKMMSDFFVNAKYIKRDNKYMVYVKEAEKIGDFLRLIGASRAVLYYEDIRIYRDHKNMTNRLNNCEQANVDKMIATAAAQLRDIDYLEAHGMLSLLDEKVQEVAQYRKKYPEASLVELSDIISLETRVPITKSGLYHRFKKMKELAAKQKKKTDHENA